MEILNSSKKNGRITITYDESTCFDVKKLDDKLTVAVTESEMEIIYTIIKEALQCFLGAPNDNSIKEQIENELLSLFKLMSKFLHIPELAALEPVFIVDKDIATIKLRSGNKMVEFITDEEPNLLL